MTAASDPAPRGLDALLRPRGVAVVGASATPGKVGNAVARNLLFGGPGTDRSRGFPGLVVPVNRRGGEVLGVPACSSVDELEGPVDLAVLAVPAPEVPGALDAAARRGVRAAIVLAAGFHEAGEQGRRLEAQVRSVARNTGVRVVGPNCTGVFAAERALNASFFSAAPRLGGTTLISQSGAIAQALVLRSHAGEIGLRNVVSLGDKVDVADAELVSYFARDPSTTVLALYAESLGDVRDFHEAVREAALKKPIVALHGGRTGAGHRAAKLHGGGIQTMSRQLTASGLALPGVQLTETLPAFLSAIQALALQRPGPGRRVAIVTNAGGCGVLAADAVGAAGLDVVKLTQETVRRLARVAPNPRATQNPIDLLGDAKADRFVGALEVVAQAEEVDGVLVILTDQAMTDPVEVARRVGDYARGLRKPIVASFVGTVDPACRGAVVAQGIPEYDFPEQAVEGLRALLARGNYLRRAERLGAPAKTTRSVRRRSLARW